MQETREITLGDLFTIPKRCWIWLVIAPMVTGAAAYAYWQKQPNVYTAHTRLYVFMEYIDSLGQIRYDTSTSTEFTGDFQELIQTRQIYQETVDRLGGTLDMMNGVDINVSAVSGTRVLMISVTSTSPTLSLDIANTISEVFVSYISKLIQKDAVNIAAEATLPEQPSGPPRLKYTALAALAGFAIAAFLSFAVLFFGTKITGGEDVEATLNAPVLARIPDYRDAVGRYMKRKRPRGKLRDAVPEATVEATRMLSTNLQFACNGALSGTVVMLTSAIAIEGKSTLTLLLADALTDDGFTVLMCDFDVKRPTLGHILGRRNRSDIVDYLSGKATFQQITVQTTNQNVYFVDCRHQIYSISQIMKHPGFSFFLSEARSRFDVILLDTAPLGMFIDAAMLSTVADGTLLVIGNGMVERSRETEVLSQLKKANANLLGVALNYIRPGKGHRYYYEHYK